MIYCISKTFNVKPFNEWGGVYYLNSFTNKDIYTNRDDIAYAGVLC